MNNIANERRKIGVTQSQLARKCGWLSSRLANYESGTRRPDLESCRTLVAAINRLGGSVTIDDLFPPSVIALSPEIKATVNRRREVD